MESIIEGVTKLLSSEKFQPYLENLRKQNEMFIAEETTKLLGDDSVSEDEDEDVEADEEEYGETDKEVAMAMLKKLAKLFQYASLSDKAVLLIGTIFTVVHAASFPILAILFGSISNAYIATRLRDLKNTTLHPYHNDSAEDIGGTGHLALSFLSNIAGSVSPGANASIVPTEDALAHEGSNHTGIMAKLDQLGIGHMQLYHSTGNETMDDFANYVADFSLNYIYIGIAVFIAAFIQTACWEWIAENQLYRVRLKFIYQTLRQDMTWFSRHTTGNLILKLADDCERFREGIGHKFSMIIEYIAIAVLGAGIGFIVNSTLTLIFLASTPIIMTKTFLIWKKIADKSEVQQKQYGKAAKISSEVLQSVRSVSSATREHEEVSRYKKALEKGAKAAERKELLLGIGIGGMYFLIYSFYAIALWYAINLLSQGAITPGDMYTVFFSLTISAFAVGSLLPFVNTIATSFGCIRLLETVLERVPKIDPYSLAGDTPKSFSGRLKLSNIHFHYPGREEFPVFKGLDFEISGGQTVAIVGQSSSGKTTLVNLLLRFYDPQKGQIKMDKTELKSLNVRWIREHIGVAEQFPTLRSRVSIFENIRGSNKKIKYQQVVKAAKLAFVHKFVKSLPMGYNTILRLPAGMELSLGQRQRIAIARIMLRNPTVLILDQAMSAIPVSIATKIEANLSRIRPNMTNIIIAHKLAVARNCDFIFVLQNSKIAEKGTHEALMEIPDGIYHGLVKQENFVESFKSSKGSSIIEEALESETDEEIQSIGEGSSAKAVSKALEHGAKASTKKHKKIPSIAKIVGVVPDRKLHLFLGFVGCILSGLVIPILAFNLGQILELFIGTQGNIFKAGIFWVEMLMILAVTAGIGFGLRTIYIGIAGESITMSLRVKTYENLLRQPISWFDSETNQPAFLYARLASDIPFVRAAIGPRLGTALSAVITMTTALIIATIFGWELALITFMIIPILLFGFYLQKKAQENMYHKLSHLRKTLIKITNGVIKAIWTVQAGSQQFGVVMLLDRFLQESLKVSQKRAIFYGLGCASSESIMFFIFGFAFRLGAELIRNRVLSIPDLFTIFFVITFGSLSIGQAITFIPDYVKARISAAFIFKLIETKSQVDPYSDKGETPKIHGEIEFRNVSFSYPLKPNALVLKNVNFTIPPGSSLGITGTTGGGKSTLLSILPRFYEPSEGDVLIDGVRIKDINLKHLRRNIGYVDQTPTIFDRTVRENIIYGYHGEATGGDLTALVEKAAAAADADFITEELPEQYETKCGDSGRNLTAGQRTEIAMARAVIGDPPILLLDDPLSVLDREEGSRVLRAIGKVTKGRTCILVSNNYWTIQHCTYIALLINGNIAEFGLQRDLIRNEGLYYQFVREQGVNLQTYDD